jgi:hypothetical protein
MGSRSMFGWRHTSGWLPGVGWQQHRRTDASNCEL